MDAKLETHCYSLEQEKEYTKVYFVLSDDIYFDIVFHTQNDIESERDWINRFIRTVLCDPLNANRFIIFEDDGSYRHFCIRNKLTYKPQTWFKIAYMKGNIEKVHMRLFQICMNFELKYHEEKRHGIRTIECLKALKSL